MRAPVGNEASVQVICRRRPMFERINKGLGQKKAGGVDVLCCLHAISGAGIEADQCGTIIIRMGLQKGHVQIIIVHEGARAAVT